MSQSPHWQGCPKAPAVCICRTAKFLPTGVGFCAEGDPWSGCSIRPSRGGPPGGLIPALFRGLTEGLPTRENTRLPVKQAGLAIPDPVLMAPEKWTASCVITGDLVAALRSQTTFRTADHTACLRGGRLAVRHRGVLRAEAVLTASLEGAPVQQARHMQQAAKIGAWLTVLPSTVNGTELGAQEWRDALFLRYGLEPPDLS